MCTYIRALFILTFFKVKLLKNQLKNAIIKNKNVTIIKNKNVTMHKNKNVSHTLIKKIVIFFISSRSYLFICSPIDICTFHIRDSVVLFIHVLKTKKRLCERLLVNIRLALSRKHDSNIVSIVFHHICSKGLVIKMI